MANNEPIKSNTKEDEKHPGPSPTVDIENPAARRFLQVVRELLRLTRDYGMPLVAFAVGIALLIQLAMTGGLSEVQQAVVAVLLVVGGLVTQLWIYLRNQRTDASKRQLDWMMDMFEKYLLKR